MGTILSRESGEEVSKDLRTLGSADILLEDKEAAFERLRDRFVRKINDPEKLEACAAVEAQRFPIWPLPPGGATCLSSERLADRVRGLVFGCALGDSAGLATEFLNSGEVSRFYGRDFAFCPKPAKIYPDIHRLNWQAGDWTDDTDQMVLIMQSLLACVGIPDNIESIH